MVDFGTDIIIQTCTNISWSFQNHCIDRSITTVYLCKNASATAKSVLQSFGEKRSKLLTCMEAAYERGTATLTIPTQRFCLLGLCVPEKDLLVNDVSLQLFWPALLLSTLITACFVLFCTFPDWLFPYCQRSREKSKTKHL